MTQQHGSRLDAWLAALPCAAQQAIAQMHAQLQRTHTLWILDAQRQPQPMTDRDAWCAWLEDTARRTVGYTSVTAQVYISTVFLGIGMPGMLFETMVFVEEPDAEREEAIYRALPVTQQRYGTWAEAEVGHALVVAQTQAALGVSTLLQQGKSHGLE